MPWPADPVVGNIYPNYNSLWLYNADNTYTKVLDISTTSTAKFIVRTMAQLTTPAADINQVIRVLDASEGEVIAYSDGTTYRRILDNSPVN